MYDFSDDDKYDYQAKILTIGESGVGKTCIISRFTKNEFSLNHLATIAIDFKLKRIQTNEKTIKLQIWDTAGQERFNTLTTGFFKGSDGIILCYSVIDQNSFECVNKWMTQIKNLSPADVKVILVGNKSDCHSDRIVSRDQGIHIAEQYNIPFFECSAKTGENITQIFDKMGELVLDKLVLKKKEIENSMKTHDLLEKETDNSKSATCCGSTQ